jgi:hypothetical protein
MSPRSVRSELKMTCRLQLSRLKTNCAFLVKFDLFGSEVLGS